MLIDTHAHIYLDVFEDDLDQVVNRAREAGVARIVMPAIDVPSMHKAIDLCERYDGLYAMVGLHPSETKDAVDSDFEAVVDLCANEHVVAVGETGLDYYWDRSFDERQQTFLRRHIRLAAARRLPIVFHNREAFDELIRIVEEERDALEDPASLYGIFHCFTGTSGEAERVTRAGFYVGIGGILTFKNENLVRHVRNIPLERIVLETDAPYLTPEPHRGKRNEPAYVECVAQRLAEILGLDMKRIARTTTSTAEEIFGFQTRR